MKRVLLTLYQLLPKIVRKCVAYVLFGGKSGELAESDLHRGLAQHGEVLHWISEVKSVEVKRLLVVMGWEPLRWTAWMQPKPGWRSTLKSRADAVD